MCEPEPKPWKSAWPELVGKLATLALTMIACDRMDVAVEVLRLGSPVIPDYNPKRVCVYIDNNGLVAKIPVIG